MDPALRRNMKVVKLPINAPTSEPHPDWQLVNSFKQRVEEMLSSGKIDKEFEEIEGSTADANLTGDFSSALQPYNLFKNRYRNILPCESCAQLIQMM